MPTGSLPKKAKALWEDVYQKAKKQGNSEEKAAKKAWGAVKQAGWYQDENDKWHKKAELTEFSLTVKRAAFDKITQEMRWRADTSDIEEDARKDNMTMELYEDFLQHIDDETLVPEFFQSDFWKGGQPYLSVSHYPDLNGKGVPGPVDNVYIDGDSLKAKGRFDDTPLGRACFNSLCQDLYGEKRNENDEKVRVSIAFLDWMHEHKSSGFIFERETIDDICPECILEWLTDEYEGRKFRKGQLVHFALTRVPINERTLMEVDRSMAKTRKEDAATIIGDEQAEELEEEATLVGKSGALVTMSEEEVLVEEAKPKQKKEEKEEEDDKEEEGKKKKEKKVEKSEVEPITFDVIKAQLDNLQSALTPPEEPSEPHPLDGAISQFKSDFDEAIITDLSPDEKLQLLQDSYAVLGSTVRNLIAEVPEKVEKSETEGDETTKVLLQAFDKFGQQLDLISTQLGELKQPENPEAPVRRSLRTQPFIPEDLQYKQVEKKSETPGLRSIIERTTQ